VSHGQETPDSEAVVIKPRNTIAGKVRKISGSAGDLSMMSDRDLSNARTDYRSVVDSDTAALPALLGQWMDLAKRSAAVAEFRKLAKRIGSRATPFGHVLLGRVTDLFIAYLDRVAPAEQDRVAIGSYLGAIQVIWKQNMVGDGGKMGAQMAADLEKLNLKAAGA
jgi:hypothetical protein